jgi:murein DD-endopeptidase MepM/ murein hydrolase activator NlpD
VNVAALAALVLAITPTSVPAAATAEVTPAQVGPGGVVLLTVHGAATAPGGTLAGRPLRFFAAGEGTWRAFGPLPIETPPGAAPLALAAEGAPLPLALEVLPPSFRVTHLTVEPRFLTPPASMKKRIKADQAAIDAAYAQPFGPPRFDRPFAWPLQAELSSRYGDQRTYNGQTSGVHYGLDLAAARGTPIEAAQAGVVVLVRDCYYSGNTVVVSHGAGLFTSYLHQARTLVKVGELVAQGQRLGLVGSTGRSTGPHLHWGVKVDGLWVDPQAMLRLPWGPAAEQVPAAVDPVAPEPPASPPGPLRTPRAGAP